MSKTTQRVIDDYNKLDDNQFKNKYKTTKDVYAKRVEKYGDPYKRAKSVKVGIDTIKTGAKTAGAVMAISGTVKLASVSYDKIKSGRSVAWQVLDTMGNIVYTKYQ